MLSEVKLPIPASIRSAYAGEQITGTNLIYDSNWNNNVGATQDVINNSLKYAIDNIDGKEDKTNKVITLSSSSTDTQYPSAKIVYTELQTKLDYEVGEVGDEYDTTELDNRVAYTAQTKTDAEKAIARNNIGVTDTNVTQSAKSGNSEYPILLKNSANTTTETASAGCASGITANPSTGAITATSFVGTATRAMADASGNTFSTTYATKDEVADITSITSVNVNDLFAATPAIPSGYTFTELRNKSLYCKVGNTYFPVTLKSNMAFYVDYDGNTISAVSTSYSTGDHITVSGTLKDTNENALADITITFTPIDTSISATAVTVTSANDGTYTTSGIHTGTGYTISLSSGTPVPSSIGAYMTTGNKTLDIIG